MSQTCFTLENKKSALRDAIFHRGMWRRRPGSASGIQKGRVQVGKLIYDGTLEVEFEDRVLAHLQLVIGLKLRRREGFFFSWRDEQAVGDGRSAIWIDPSISLVFRYNGGRTPKINKDWLEALSLSSNSAQGLQLTDEAGAYGRSHEQ